MVQDGCCPTYHDQEQSDNDKEVTTHKIQGLILKLPELVVSLHFLLECQVFLGTGVTLLSINVSVSHVYNVLTPDTYCLLF